MPPPFTDEHERFRAHVRSFIARELAPGAPEWERAHTFPDDVFRTLASAGLLGLKYPAELGGGPVSGEGFDVGGVLADAVLSEELARCGSGGLAAGIGAHIGIATPPIWSFGTPEQRARYLPAAIRGERIAALAITEPGAGSDVAAVRTRARRVDGGFVVNGSKMFITNGVRADFLVTAVTTGDDGPGGHHGLSFLIIDRGARRALQPDREARLARLGHRPHLLRGCLRPGGEPPRPGERGLLPDHGQLPVGTPADVARSGRSDDLGARAHPARRAGAVAPAGGDAQALRHRVAELALALQAGRDLTYHALRLHAEGLTRCAR